MKLSKNKIIVVILVAAVLALAFWWGGNAPGLQGWNISSDTQQGESLDVSLSQEPVTKQSEENKGKSVENKSEDSIEQPSAQPTAKLDNTEKHSESLETRPGGLEGELTAQGKIDFAKQLAGGSSPGVEKGDADYSLAQGMEFDESTGKDKYLTDPVPEGKPVPIEPQNVVISDKKLSCTLSVRCDAILDNIDWLDSEKLELVPKDGVIFTRQTVSFYEGESVFNLLLREMKKNKIHMEFVNTPMYNSAYIEGIHNLYEFDCGELSGWMYKVNGWFPNYGCSRYQLKEGDVVEWEYSCNLGVDVGGYSALGAES